MPRKKSITKKVGEKIEEITPEPKKYKKVEISEISQKIPQNARFGMVIAVAILWVEVIKNCFIRLFSYFNIIITDFQTDIIIAVIVTLMAWIIFMSWTKITRKIGNIKVRVQVKQRDTNGNSKKRR